ncbi:hypothetical protein J0A65_26245, partial [Bowmanella sp. Y57]|nr:hypothetical protein [Bowmanella yangjiangensis]
MRGMLDRPEQELILVADDSQEVRERIGALLVERYQVRLVAADQALAAACEVPQPDLILLGWQDDYALCRQFKREAQTRHIPLILVT